MGFLISSNTLKNAKNTDLNTNSSPSIIYIYNSDFNSSIVYGDFLVDAGYLFSSINMSDINSNTFDNHDLIIIGNDTGYEYIWGTSRQSSIVNESNKKIIGIGFGGSTFFSNISLNIGWGDTWMAQIDAINISSPAHPIFNNPNDIPKLNPLELYSINNYSLAVYVDPGNPLGENTTYLGLQSNSISPHYPIIMQFDKYLSWGFTQDPTYMTENGTKLFINAVSFLVGPPETETTEPIPGFGILGSFITISLMMLFLIRKRKFSIKNR